MKDTVLSTLALDLLERFAAQPRHTENKVDTRRPAQLPSQSPAQSPAQSLIGTTVRSTGRASEEPHTQSIASSAAKPSDTAGTPYTADSGNRRIIVAVAGPPGSGKSTLAEALVNAVNEAAGTPLSVIVPMDGFHFDNAILEQRGWLNRKGAPHTFDVAGYEQCIRV